MVNIYNAYVAHNPNITYEFIIDKLNNGINIQLSNIRKLSNI
jgi:hypothetical protein